ncbi:MAG: baseplate J/gp47 family protein, partial [Lachnospiraceae bacterium]|nr:baseplate J/gp47 family protein [Lachnospiraceae bacterium]
LELLYDADRINWKTIMKKRDFLPDAEYDITIQEVLWEYYNGYGWTRLPLAPKYTKVFCTDENMRGQRVKLEFDCPQDIQRILVNSAETYYIRARIVKLNNEFKTRGAYIVPVIGNFSLFYDYSRAPLSPAFLMEENNLVSRRFARKDMEQEGFAVPFCKPSPDQKTCCYLGFESPPTGGPLKILFVLQDAAEGSMPGVEWEYLSEDGWKKMNVVDGTRSFRHTGIISWFGSRDIRRTTMFQESLFWIRMADAQGAYGDRAWKECCPRIEGVYPNSTRILGVETLTEVYTLDPQQEEKRIVLPYGDIASIQVRVSESADDVERVRQQVWTDWQEADELPDGMGASRLFTADRQEGVVTFPKYMDTARLNEHGEIEVSIRYKYCRGDKGNLEAGAIDQLGRTVGFINSSYNPIATVCGTPQETVTEAARRNAKRLRHGHRCVSAGDYEAMVWEATRSISKVKCFSGYDQNRKEKNGAVTLVVLPKENGEESYSFERTRMRIYEYLSGYMDENLLHLGLFHIVRPEMIRLDVRVTIELWQEKEVFVTRKRVLDELERFLDPMRGNFHGEGWEIGTLPGKNQIMNALKRVKGVRHISGLTLRGYKRGHPEETEIDEKTLLSGYLLPMSGVHEILIDM